MKKSVFVLIVGVALVSIILVAFVGANYSIVDNQTVYVASLVLDNKTLVAEGGSQIYEVLEKKSYLIENPTKESTFARETDEDGKITGWYDYIIRIKDYNSFYDYYGNSITLQAHCTPSDATNKKIRFAGREKDQVYATVTQNGEGEAEVKYVTKMDVVADIEVTMNSTDGSNLTSYIKIRNQKYK